MATSPGMPHPQSIMDLLQAAVKFGVKKMPTTWGWKPKYTYGCKIINNRPRTLRLQLAILVVCCVCHGPPASGADDAASLSD